MKRLLRAGLVALWCGAAHAQSSAPEVFVIDVSNTLILPSCRLDVSLEVVELPRSVADRAGVSRIVASTHIRLNGRTVGDDVGLNGLLIDPSRIVSPGRGVACGFIVEQGDASSFSRTRVVIGRHHVLKVEQLDDQGLAVSTTTFRSRRRSLLN